LKDVAPSNLKANTLANYHNYSKRTFAAIGHLRLDKVTPRHIQQFIKDLETGERFDKYRKGALSAKTIKNHIAFISSVFEYARKMQVLSFNPCGSVILPKDRAEEQQQEIYTVEETQNILALLCQEEKKNFHYVIYFLLAVYTGFRRGDAYVKHKLKNFSNYFINRKKAQHPSLFKGTALHIYFVIKQLPFL